MVTTSLLSADETKEYYEVRSYVLGEQGDAPTIDAYLQGALLPALQRQGIGPVGVFGNAPGDESHSPRIVVVVPYSSADQIASTKAKIDGDPQYQSDAKSYLERAPDRSPFQRIESELLISMDCLRKLHVPKEGLGNQERVYEFRVYESPNERLGDLKVDMFNSGEVPIFLACGIQPVFIGQSVVGPYTPSLSYLTLYPNESARLEAWKAFREHPDWLVLKDVAKYQGTVNKIHKFVLSPKPYSQM